MARYSYCKICKKEIEEPSRKPMETFHKMIWVIIILATVGIAALVFAIYYFNRKKIYCPTCNSKLEFSSEPFEKEEKEEESVPLTPKEQVLKKTGKKSEVRKRPKEYESEEIGEEEQRRSEQTFCPYCGEDIKPDAKRCPYCGSSLKVH